jgi:uncharacterized ferritin-like protein (DUF455 family)
VSSVFDAAGGALAAIDPDDKLRQTQQALAAWCAGQLTLTSTGEPLAVTEPGRPPYPLLVHPRELPRRSLHTETGRSALIHAIAHIEFNAINLALDAVHRFRGLPRDYYGDWLRVAAEEAYHFNLLRERLRASAHDYGDYPAHDGLWDMARRTAHDPLARMALVPRVLEARGLDVTPGMMQKLTQAGDAATAAVLDIILSDEVEHVAIGSRWFRFLCRQRGLEPEATFQALLNEYFQGELRGPFNHSARRQAGFSAAELAWLERDKS